MSAVPASGPPSGGRREPRFAEMIRSPDQLLSLSLGLGLAPVAPGTFGTVGGYPLFLALALLPLPLRVVVYVGLVALGSWAAGRTGEALGEHDHGAIVFDETIAMALVLEFTPPTTAAWIVAFLLFRLFDIWKPWPIRLADERGHGGFFVILDDLLAAVWAVACILAAHAAGWL